MKKLIVVCLLIAVLSASCGGGDGGGNGDSAAIKNVIHDMWDAYNQGNYAKALTYCTNYGDEDEEIAQMTAMKNFTGNVTVKGIENIKISGSSATAKVTLYIAGQTDIDEVKLVKIDGNWKINMGEGTEPPPVINGEETDIGYTTSVGFEDLPLCDWNDWDHNDWLADINVTTYDAGIAGDMKLYQMDFVITPQTHMTAFDHEMHLAVDAFDGTGTWELFLNEVRTASGGYTPSGIDVVLYSSTGAALTSGTVARLSVYFPEGIYFNVGDYDPFAAGTYHGEGLFYDPYIKVLNTGDVIHAGDARMLSVPTDWTPPGEGTAIWVPYPKVGAASDPCVGPVFTAYWWKP